MTMIWFCRKSARLIIENIFQCLTIFTFIFQITAGFSGCLVSQGIKCLECKHGFYFPNLFKNMIAHPEFAPEECIPKFTIDLIYEKIVSVKNIGGDSGKITYADLGTALIKEAELSLPYSRGSIEFIVFDTPQFIDPMSLPYPQVELFKRSGLNITIRATTEDECGNLKISICNTNILLILKTQAFGIFISNQMTIKNIIFDGSDINYNLCERTIICCSAIDLSKTGAQSPCGLLNLEVKGKTAESLKAIPALFSLLTLEDYDYHAIMIPILAVENVEFRNIYDTYQGTGWQTLIKTSELLSTIRLIYVNFTNIFFPLGIYKQMTLNEDPYFSFYSIDEQDRLKSLFKSKSIGENIYSLSLYKVFVTAYESIFFTLSIDSSTRYPDWTLFELRGSYIRINISEVTIKDCWMRRHYYFLKVSNNTKATTGSIFYNIKLSNFTGLGLMKSYLTNWDLAFINLKTGSLSLGNAFLFSDSVSINMKSINLDECFNSNFQTFKLGSILQVIMNEIAIQNSKSIYFYAEKCTVFSLSSFFLSNVTNIIPDLFNFIFLTNGEVNISRLNFQLFTTINNLFSIKAVGALYLTNSEFTSLSYPLFFSWTGALPYGNITVYNLNFTYISGYYASPNSATPASLLFDLISYTNLTIRKLNFTNSVNTFLMRNVYSSLYSLIEEVSFDSIDLYSSYFIQNYLIVTPPKNNTFLMRNCSFTNFLIRRDILFMFFTAWVQIYILNCTFYNITYGQIYTPASLVQKCLFYGQYTKFINISGCSFTHVKDDIQRVFIGTKEVKEIVLKGNNFISRSKIIKRSGGIFFYNTDSLTLDSNNFQGLVFNTEEMFDPLEIYGVIAAVGTGNLLKCVVLYNTFYSVEGVTIYGSIGFNEYQSLEIHGNKFINSRSKYGGGVSIFKSPKVSFFNNSFFNCSAVEGGSLFLFSVTQFIMDNTTFTFSKAENEGGAINANMISNLTLTRTSFIFSSSEGKGGSISLRNCSNALIENLTAENSSSSIGGVFFLEGVIAKFTKIKCLRSIADKGGLILISSTSSQIIFMDTIVEDTKSYYDGGVLYTTNILSLKLKNFSTKFCESLGGFGVISLNDFSTSGDILTQGVFDLANITCLYNKGFIGSCISVKSNNLLKINGMLIENNYGSVITMKSDMSFKFSLSNIILRSTNVNYDKNNKYLINPAISIVEADVIFTNSTFIENQILDKLFKVENSRVTLAFCLFDGFFIDLDNRNQSSKNLFVLFSHQSSLILNNLYMSNIRVPRNTGFYLTFFEGKLSNIFFSKSAFFSCFTNGQQPFLFQNSQVFMESCYFGSNTGALSGALTFFSSEVKITSTEFRLNLNKFDKNIILGPDSSLNIYDENIDDRVPSSLIITFCRFLNKYGVGVIVKNLFSLNLKYSFFTAEETAQTLSQAIFIFSTIKPIIAYCFLENFKAQNGAAITIQHFIPTIYVNTSIENCIFSNNRAGFGGAIYAVGQIKLRVEGCSFLKNEAVLMDKSGGFGGAVLMDCEFYSLCSVNFVRSLFQNNIAENAAGALLSKSERTYIETSSFINNTDLFNSSVEGFSRYPLKIFALGDIGSQAKNSESIFETINRILKNNISTSAWDYQQEIVSGWEFNTSFVLTDSDLNVVVVDNVSRASFERQIADGNENNKGNVSTSKVLIEKGQTGSNRGIFLFTNLKVTAEPNTVQEFKITVVLGSDLYFKSTNKRGDENINIVKTLTLRVKMFVRPCIRGEVWTEGNVCQRCEKGTFSIWDPMSPKAPRNCRSCLNNAICRGGDLLTPLPGYWRASNTSLLILKCPIPEACEGVPAQSEEVDKQILTNGKCLPEHLGVLCYECKRGMVRVKSKTLCKPCSDQPLIYIKTLVSLLFLICYVIFQANIFSKIEKQESHVAVCMKLLMNHFQTIGLINLIDLGWTVDFNMYFAFQDYVSFLTEDFFIIDCFISSINEDLHLMKVIFTIILPLALGTIIFIIWIGMFLKLIFKKKKKIDKNEFLEYISEKMRVSLLVIAYLLFPEILRKTFSLLNCKEIDDSLKIKVLSFSPNAECWSTRHKFWIYTVCLPGFIFWGILVPAALYFILKKSKRDIILFLHHQKEDAADSKRKVSIQNAMLVPSTNSVKDFNTLSVKSLFPDGLVSLESIKEESSDPPSMINMKEEGESQQVSKKSIDFSTGGIFPKFIRNSKYVNSILISNKNNRVSVNLSLVVNIGFLYRGYRDKYYYWEIVLFSRKFFLILIGIFTEIFPNNIKATVFLVVLVIYLYAQIVCKPFRYSYLNKLEVVSLLACFFTGNIGVLLFSDTVKNASLFFVLLVALINLGFLLFWTHQFLKKAVGFIKIRIFFLRSYNRIAKILGFRQKKYD